MTTPTVRYRERLWVPLWWWPLGMGLTTLLALELNVALYTLPNWVGFAVLLPVAAVVLLWLGRHVVKVTATADGQAVISLPAGVFKPYAGVSTAILLFTKTNSGGTDHVWFYDVGADGFSLDDKRNPIEANDLPDALSRWALRDSSELERARTEQSFCVPVADIVAQGYDLSLNRYKEIVHDEVEHRPPLEIIAEIEKLEGEIATGLAELKAMLS